MLHPQSRSALIVSEPRPPDAANCSGLASALTWHLLLDGATDVTDARVQAEVIQAAASQAAT